MKTSLRSCRAFAPLVIWAGLLILGGLGVAVVNPKVLHGATRRAERTEKAAVKLEAANTSQGASAAADVATIGAANAMAPESPSKDFISRELPVVLSKLPGPDPLELLASERRRSAVMEGRALEAEKLYAAASAKADLLSRQKAAALLEVRRANESNLESAAVARAAESRQRLLCLALLVGGLLYWYVKATHVPSGALAVAVRDIRGGAEPIGAIDSVTTLGMQRLVRVHHAFSALVDRLLNRPGEKIVKPAV